MSMRHAIISGLAAFATTASKLQLQQTSSTHISRVRYYQHKPLHLAKVPFFDRRRSSKRNEAMAMAEQVISTQTSAAGADDVDVDQQLSKKMANLDLSKITKFAHQKGDALFGYIEQCQVKAHANNANDDAPSITSSNDDNAVPVPCFGNFLDAGTGSHSLRWIASILHRPHLLSITDNGEMKAPTLSMKSYTAITADETMRRRVYNEAKELGIEEKGHVIIGNWNEGVVVNDHNGGVDLDNESEALLKGQQFDTILADYLVGAIDGFSPYFQDQIFHRLMHHLAPGGRMYIIGLQPIPDTAPGDANVFCKITKARDACILLGGHRCYREYPLDWIERHLTRAGLKVVESRTYPIRYDHATMVRQINVGRSKFKLFPSKGMAKEMGGVLDELEKEALEVTKRAEGGRITLGFDYVIVAERPKDD